MEGETKPARRRLRDVPLDRAGKKLRMSSLYVVIALAGANVIAYAIERHHEDLRSLWGSPSKSPEWGPWHSLAAESYFFPILVPVFVIFAARWAAKGFPRALLPGVLAIGHLFAIVMAWLLNHLFDYTEGGGTATFLTLALAVLGLWLIIIEIVMPIRQRRRLEGTDPVFPTATALPPRDRRSDVADES